MSLRRNWFIYLVLLLYLMTSMIILNMGMNEIIGHGEDSYFLQVLLYIGFLGLYILINILFFIMTRPWLIRIFLPLKDISFWVEAFFVLFILEAGLAIRFYYIAHYPVGLDSDYKNYYDIAIMIKNKTLLTESNNEFIALFPHVFGYSYILSKVMLLFGTSVVVCLYFNAILSVLTSLLCYGIGKITTGKMAGFIALILSCFWPSQIIYSNFNGSEALFTFLLYGAIYLFFYIMKIHNSKNTHVAVHVTLHLMVGILLAIASSIRPFSMLFLIAVMICLAYSNSKLEYKNNINEISSSDMFLTKGWFRAIIIFMGYFICSQLISASITQAIEKDITDTGSLGYTLMVGVDIKHNGCFSDESTKFLFDTYRETGSADETNKACFNRAITTMKENPTGVIKLLATKFYLLWAVDDYSTTLNLNTMGNQGRLTDDRRAFYNKISRVNSVYYVTVVLMAAIGVCFLFLRDNNISVIVVFFIGAVVVHLMVEVQNRYHYYLLEVFCLLAALGLDSIYRLYQGKSKQRIKLVSEIAVTKLNIVNDQDNLDKIDEQPSIHKIDIIQAIKDGHIIITASKDYEELEESKSDVDDDKEVQEIICEVSESIDEYDDSDTTNTEDNLTYNDGLAEEIISASRIFSLPSREELLRMKTELEEEIAKRNSKNR